MWFRIELDNTGAILSCEETGAALRNGRYVRYVEADTKAAACSFAKQWYENRKEWRRKSDKKLQQGRRAAGLCRSCPQPVCGDSVRFCQRHLDMNKAHQRRWAKGETTPVAPVDPTVARDRELARMRDKRRERRVALTPRQVLSKYDELDGRASPFRSWLVMLSEPLNQAEAAE